jgi:uncharacterized protein
MTRIHILGGTGYAGSYIAREAAARGHQVISYSLDAPDSETTGVTYRLGDVLDDDFLASTVDDADVAFGALSPRGELEGDGKLRGIYRKVEELAARRGVRFGAMGGAGSLLVAPDGPKLVDTDALPASAKPEAREMTGVLDDLLSSDKQLDWFLVCPAPMFGASVPGEATGHYRSGGDVILRDDSGDSAISGADLALAVIDEVEHPAHHRQRFTVGH